MREPGQEQEDAREDMIESIARELRHPVIMDAALDARIMDAVRPVGRQRRRAARVHAAWTWGLRRRQFALSPLGAVALAAGLAFVAVLGARAFRPVPVRVTADAQPAASDPLVWRTAHTGPVAARVTQFTLVAPGADRVALVGDFNDWKAGATPMVPTGEGVFSVALALMPGRYTYMFLVDGRPMADPATPPTLRDSLDFDAPSSVITVEEAP